MAQRGFTLIELLVTVTIVAILASGAMQVMHMTVQRGKEAELRASLRQMREALDAYKKAYDEGHIRKVVGESGYPPTLEVLQEGVEDQKDVKKGKLRFLRRIPRDPMSGDASLTAAQTWGKRSYESEADDPREGQDVYDVYSLSRKNGVNGVPYREW